MDKTVGSISFNTKDKEMAKVMNTIASSIGSQYYAIYHIWIKERTYVFFREKAEEIVDAPVKREEYELAWERYLSKYVVSEDQQAMREFANLKTLPARLEGRRSISCDYRRKGLGWTRGTFLAGEKDDEGNLITAIYSVADINSEVEIKENEKKAIYESEHDSLTGIYNRKGFERAISSELCDSKSVGFVILDIDNFKSINDTFGHPVGDQALVTLAEQLTSIFYQGDIIGRIGGDEFAILLLDCNETAWDKICRKLRMIHTALADYMPKILEIGTTVSAGLCFSNNGYSRQMYKIADNALYETKRRGRAGCTLMDSENHVLRHWHDEDLSMLAKNVMAYNSTGICRIEIPDDPKAARRLICGDNSKLILGIPKEATPEESYVFWRDRIDASYKDALDRTEKSMIENGQSECTFLWEHPEHGTIFLRCGGFGERKKNKISLTGYCHTLMDTNIIEREDNRSAVISALSNTFVASYYIDLEKDTVSTFKLGPLEDYAFPDYETTAQLFGEILDKVVDPKDREPINTFLDMSTLDRRLGSRAFWRRITGAFLREIGAGCDSFRLIMIRTVR